MTPDCVKVTGNAKTVTPQHYCHGCARDSGIPESETGSPGTNLLWAEDYISIPDLFLFSLLSLNDFTFFHTRAKGKG